MDEQLARACGDHGVVAVYLFGSAARGSTTPGDVDVAVLLGGDVAIDRVGALRADLQEVVAPARLDLVVLDHAPPTLAHRVYRDGVPLVGADRPDAVRHRAATSRGYLDTAALRRELAAGTAARLEAGTYGRP